MRVLLLSPHPERIIDAVCDCGDEAVASETAIDLLGCRNRGIDFIVSYGYRHILSSPLIGTVPAINLHISYLPWNRGASPNLWSWIEGTPKGVTIHWIDEGIDTGPIISQRMVEMGEHETLRTSYDKLRAAVERLFAECWPTIRAETPVGTPQSGRGSYHAAKDQRIVEHLLTSGYDTPVIEIVRRHH